MSATSAGPTPRIGRNYTRARTYPWVLGKLGDFVLWFGPYNAGQLVIAALGVLVLVKTFAWWSGLGPIPPIALCVLVWAARAQRIGGRAPLWVLYGLARRALQPRHGRIGGKTARPLKARHLTGTVLIEHTTSSSRSAPRPAAASRRTARPTSSRRPSGAASVSRPLRSRSVPAPAGAGGGPARTPLQQMLHDRSKAAVR
ncbi:hypothetical protein ACFFSH_37995 [Streptomyces filamentosus]|uniref:Uncharacterized protein n=1 Tax=Streptomyces filamentosus TaxID=67294 RepID=A0A919BPA7_STRFL|nr:hypothetical protein [Streptomyces filamentosus]GHG04293.1 hypothetical protein GCM10017667_38460 [Streptomyces filamentosus]